MRENYIPNKPEKVSQNISLVIHANITASSGLYSHTGLVREPYLKSAGRGFKFRSDHLAEVVSW